MAFKKKIRGKLSRFYYVDFTVGDIDVNKSTRTADYQEACKIEEAWKADAEERYFKAEDGLDTDITLQQALDHVWDSRWQYNQSGQRPYCHISRIIGMVGNVPLSNLSGQRGFVALSKLRSDLLGMDNGHGKVIGKETVDRHMTSVKTLLTDMQRKFHLYDKLTIPHIDMFNIKSGRTRTLSEEEEIKLFKLMGDDSHYSDLVRVLLDTGLRLSEALHMRYEKEIFLVKKQITLPPDMTKPNRVKSVPMTEAVFNILTRLRLAAGERPFPWRADVCSHKFARYRDKMGFVDDPQFCLHMLRHTCTTRLIQRGVDQAIVQKWMGHSNAKMTTHYTQLGVEDMRGGAAVLDEIYNSMYSDKRV